MPFFFTNRDNVDYLFLLEIFFGEGNFVVDNKFVLLLSLIWRYYLFKIILIAIIIIPDDTLIRIEF